MKTKNLMIISGICLVLFTIAALFIGGAAAGIALCTVPIVAATKKEDGAKIEDVPDITPSPSPNNEIKELKDEIVQMKTAINTINMPKENFKSEANKKSQKIQDGRNYLKSIIYRDSSLMPASYKATNWLNESVAGEGGNLVPQEWYNQIMSNVQESSVVRRNATVVNANAKELLVPKLSTLPAFTFVNEGVGKSVSNPGFSQIKMSRKDGGFIVLLSKQLIEDNAFDIMGFVSDMASRVISNAIDEAGFKGLGSITGILNSSAGATPVVLAGAAATFNYDSLIDCIAAVPSDTLPGAKWYMHRSILAAIRKMKDTTDRYVLDSIDRKQNTIEGYPVEVTDHCYDLQSGSATKGLLAFGDLKQMFLMERLGITMGISDAASVLIGETQINLWQQGLIGLNFGVSFDINFVYPESMAIVLPGD